MIPDAPDLSTITKAELDALREALCQNAQALLSFVARIDKLLRTALNESDAMLTQELQSIVDMIKNADGAMDQIGSRIDRARMDAEHALHKQTVATTAPARPPLKRGRGMVKVVTSQSRGPTAQEVFDHTPSSILKRPHYIQEDGPDDDDIPF